jgi:cell division transport system permease protein
MEKASYSQYIDKVTYTDNRDVIARIERLAAAVNTWGWITTLIIAIIAVLVTFNTVRLTIYNQRQEIEIMRLVGASNWQIRGPYLVEGALYGLFAAGIGIAIFAPLLYALSSKLAVFAPGVDLFGFILSSWWEVILLSAGAGMVLGMLSSLVAIRKHLRV